MLDDVSGLREQFLGLAQVDEAAGDDVRAFLQPAGPGIDEGDDDEDAVFGEHFAVADDHLRDVTDIETFDHHVVRRRFLRQFHETVALVLDLDDGAVVGHDDVFPWGAELGGELRVHLEAEMATVHRHEVFVGNLFVHPFEFAALAMAGSVHIGVEISDDFRIMAEEIVFEFLDSAVVARDDG